jgi:hypothetical protein
LTRRGKTRKPKGHKRDNKPGWLSEKTKEKSKRGFRKKKLIEKVLLNCRKITTNN